MYENKTELERGVSITQIIFKREDGSMLVMREDPANTDYQAYLKWLEEGNTPEPADEPAGE